MTIQSFRRFVKFMVTICVCGTVTGLSSSAIGQELLGYWQLEETDDGADAVDSSGNGWDGVFEGEVDPNVEGAPGFGSGAYFDGETGQILIGPGDENGFGDLVSDFTVMAWINPDNFDTKNRVFGSAPHGGAGWGWGTAGDSLQITTWGIKDYNAPSIPLEPEEWTHAAVVLNSDNEALFYANGELVGEDFHAAEGNPTANNFYIGFACCTAPQEHFQGSLDEVAVFSGVLTEEQIFNAMTFGASNFNGQVGVIGDYNASGERDPDDIDILTAAIAANDTDTKFDLNGDGSVNLTDRTEFIEALSNSYSGDSNWDGEFNSSDFVRVFTSAKYETGQPAGWSDGDWNGDGQFNSSDFVTAFTGAGYEIGPKPGGLVVVPEPSSFALILLGTFGIVSTRRRR